jgi:hypothetical protein
MKQMQAAVDAARTRQDDLADTPPRATAPGRERTAEQAADAESLTEPLPNLQAALAQLTKTGQVSRPAARGRGAKPERGSRSGRGSRRDSSSPPNGESPVDENGRPASAALSGPRLPVQIWPPVDGVQSAQTGLAGSPTQTSQSLRQPSVDRKPPDRTLSPTQTSQSPRQPSVDRKPHDRTLSPGQTSTTTSTNLPGSILPPDRAGRSATGQTAAVPALPQPARLRARRRGPRVATAAALAVIVVAAGAVAVLLSVRTSDVSPQGGKTQRPQSPSLAMRTAKLAARWVAAEVSHDAYVACDKAMCDLLTADQFPGPKLQLIGPGSSYPLHAQVVVVTQAVQHQFGSSLATDWAPIVLTRVGSGLTAISIRIVSPQGAAAYRSALIRDLQQRKAYAHFLLGSSRVTASAPARKQLADGQVDARLMFALTALAVAHPIDILGFGTGFPGASAGVPLRVAQLADMVAASGLNQSEYLRYLHTRLQDLSAPYQPETAGLAHDSSGKLIFQIKFAAPSQLLLLGG